MPLTEHASGLGRLLEAVQILDASDLHLAPQARPAVRLNGHIRRLKLDSLTPLDTENMLLGIMNHGQRSKFEEDNDIDFIHVLPGVARFRVNVLRQQHGLAGVFRRVPIGIKSIEDLGLPGSLATLTNCERGLILVTGPTGSGKSTTLAAMIDHINTTRTGHILTIEDPVEFVHESKGCLVTQREVGAHTNSFATALRAALREDPDIILVGEMRDLETIQLAITAAETGHLVLGTLHTSSAPKTIDRIIDVFPAAQQGQIRAMLAESLQAVITQTLCASKQGGRVAALEIMVGTHAIRNLIREGKIHQIPNVMQTSGGSGMQTMENHLQLLLNRGEIDRETFNLKLAA
ncbi:MAG: type IV pilus twitching motility protein PilT [Armatimonadetes bacterium]|nr:type IV pilus twitching motility protein PilT [Armatimonadota bacterium]